MRLKKEIGFTLLFKITALMVLWWFCFSKPVSHHLSASDIQQHLLGAQPDAKGVSHADKP